jgi:hypothetical protein
LCPQNRTLKPAKPTQICYFKEAAMAFNPAFDIVFDYADGNTSYSAVADAAAAFWGLCQRKTSRASSAAHLSMMEQRYPNFEGECPQRPTWTR